MGATDPAPTSGPAGFRVRRWHLAAAAFVFAFAALMLASVLVGASVWIGLRRAGPVGRAIADVAGVHGDTADTATPQAPAPVAEWREQVALGWSSLRERPQVAADHFRRALLVDDGRAEAWRGLGVALLDAGDRAGAEEALCTARGKARVRSEALETLLDDEGIRCASPPPPAKPQRRVRKARKPSP